MSTIKNFQLILDNFKDRVSDVNKLLTLDELVLNSTISILEKRQTNLRNLNIDSAHLLGETALQQLRTIKKNESLKPHYSLIHNQCVVLLVSYFSSSMHDFFDTAATYLLNDDIPGPLKTKEIKFTLEELHGYDFDISTKIGSIISEKFDISFQDMGSISRVMKNYFSVELPWDRTVNNIITMQACRHAIAHAGERADDKLLRQLRKSSDRDLQLDLKVGDKIQFTPAEVKLGGEQMELYLSTLINKFLQC